MGVPKFYRWLSERYPCLSEVVKEYQIPEFDNLYLDMNGIIHICSHPNDDDPHFRISEEKIFQDIFHYIEFLFRMVQPRKVFFMAVDGVAPRAKMNQQRGRRFRSAKEAEQNEKKAKDRGEKLPDEVRFDSNCITPGTPFMVRLQEQLKYFVNNKISTDGLWRQCKVILSGHETPGEGEHKIMDFIRYEKSLPGYDPNTRHCLYGLDADLIMLGLCSHDPHFSLLREEVRFGGKKSQQANKRIPTPEETTFHLLHLSLLREYLDYEFQDLKKLDFYDVENIIDDWVLMGFLVGNDFIPHLPNMHINKGALPELYDTYKAVLPTMGGYMNEGGKLNLRRFEMFLKKLSESEMEKFDDIYSDSKWLEGRTAKKSNGKTVVGSTAGPSHVYELLEGKQEPGVNQPSTGRHFSSDLQKLMNSTKEFESDGEEEEDGFIDVSDTRGDFYQLEFKQHKRDYYLHKMNYSQVTASVLREQAEGYVRAIQWNLHYYYNGCISWSWFFPHHYAPWITDIKDFTNMELTFDSGTPFLPFEQLLAVLPVASKECLPPPLQWLMTAKESPIIDFFPTDFEQDLNGKQQEWEAVVVIPFIDENKLLEAIKPIYAKLNQQESQRNTHGPMWVGSYDPDDLGQYKAPAYFPTIERSHCNFLRVFREEWSVPIEKLRKGLMAGAKLDVFFPGFPTLKHIRHQAKLEKTGVKVFEQASRGESMMLTLLEQGRPEVRGVAEALLGLEVWVGWPHLVEAKVVAVQSGKLYIDQSGEREVRDMVTQGQNFEKLGQTIKQQYSSRYGVEIGKVDILVHALPMSGRKYVMAATKGRITLEKQWHNLSQPYALQAIVKDILVEDAGLKAYSTVEELFPTGTTAFMLGQPHYGAQGEVIKIDPEHKGRIQLRFVVDDEPDISSVIVKPGRKPKFYMPGFKASQRVGVSPHVVARITGTIFIMRGAREQQSDFASKSNIGLNLKFVKRQEEVCGYTRRTEEGQWLYSMETVELILQYQKLFPEVFQYICSANQSNNDNFHELDMFPGPDGLERVGELLKWLENLPSASALRQPFGTESLEEEIIKELEGLELSGRKKDVVMQVRPHLLYLPNQLAGCALVEPGTVFSLYDRVVNVREGFSVPLGLRGTVIRIQKGARIEDNVYDVLFDESFTGGLSLRCSAGRGYRMPGSSMINLTFKETGGKKAKGEKPKAVVRPFDGQEDRRENVWHNRSKADNKEQKKKKVSPPPPQMLPKPSGLLDSNPGQKKKERQNETAEQQYRILSKEKTPKDDGNLKDLWNSLSEKGPGAGEAKKPPLVPPPIEPSSSASSLSSSTSQMENSLKALLNISEKGPAEEPKFVIGGSSRPDPGTGSNPLLEMLNGKSYCRILATQLESAGNGQPRYDFITEPGTGLTACQVTLHDGSMYHSPKPTTDKEMACETAARVALESLGLVPKAVSQAPPPHTGGRGRGKGRGRGRGRGGENENVYQPWAKFSGEPVQPVSTERAARENRTEGSNWELMGTDQMDIRYRDNKKQAQPAFVPLQVSRKAAKAKERSQEKKEENEEKFQPQVEEVQASVVKKEETHSRAASEGKERRESKESTPQRSGGRGRGKDNSTRKKRIAANFGEDN